MTKRVACICEGGAERAILDLLLDKHKLIFEREDLIDEEVLKVRNASILEEKTSSYHRNINRRYKSKMS